VFALSACQLNNLTDFNHGIEAILAARVEGESLDK
jgi:hypothetical protein